MRKKFRQLSLQAKMSSIFVLANLVVFAVTVILLLGINSMSSEIDKVYQGNLRLNEVSDALMAVQDSMTDYLNSKTSDSLEEFYRNEQTYSQLVQDMSDFHAHADGRSGKGNQEVKSGHFQYPEDED